MGGEKKGYAEKLYWELQSKKEIDLGKHGGYRVYYKNKFDREYLLFLERRRKLYSFFSSPAVRKLLIDIRENNDDYEALYHLSRVDKIIVIKYTKDIGGNLPPLPAGDKVEVIVIEPETLLNKADPDLGIKIFPDKKDSLSRILYNKYLYKDLRVDKIKSYIRRRIEEAKASNGKLWVCLKELKKEYKYENEEFWKEFIHMIKNDEDFIYQDEYITTR
ncbi:hypothetical protein Shell_0487 [Staphylothermus hellenicus DSM 12710]|uniref:Uncharacterized protein n=1 Tax=Staphylothermus hellenicus (strain DSM 12710 / JCM 10830 / BK20S6-10-b1 / P8) TaxID=591019 RepID=D7DBS1_STAHD|nr:hypothetical protein Shell_0487 [Staphylothermus hellenicus DSM 12710]